MALATLSPREQETIAPEMRTEYLIKKFHKMVERDGLMEELKKRMYYVSKSAKRREKSQKARLRASFKR